MKTNAKIIAALAVFSAVFFSCGKSQQNFEAQKIAETQAKHTWYYFSDGNFKKAEGISCVPETPFRPWTEAARISDISVQDSKDDSVPRGFAVVNRTGILVFNGEQINLYSDSEIFSNSTQGNLVFYNETPVFSIYRNSFFNRQKASQRPAHTFLVQFNTEQNVCYPVLNVENLGLPATAEITDFIWDGQYWTCSVKDSGNEGEKINFSYLTFQPKTDLTYISPKTAESYMFITQNTEQEFRRAKAPEDFSKAPERIKRLVSSLPKNLSFSLKVKNASGHTPRIFENIKNFSEKSTLEASAILSDTWAACIFSDGSFFLNGALFENRILNHGKTIALKLPKMPSGFYYRDFAISGMRLYASWEENSFYTIARSGFICVDLNEILYKNEFNW